MSAENQFAKLYETSLGQVLVVLDQDDEGPQIRYSCKPEGLGVCTASVGFPDDDAGWENAERAFQNTDEDMALDVARKIIFSATGVEA